MGVEINSAAMKNAAAGVASSLVDMASTRSRFESMVNDLGNEWTTTGGTETIKNIRSFINSKDRSGLQGYIDYLDSVKETLETLTSEIQSIE